MDEPPDEAGEARILLTAIHLLLLASVFVAYSGHRDRVDRSS
ncbi:hypothetical protein OV203_05050 [Nannocystis sp. ILAH1]|nr:hypothetical protein [Nannocystis sp. ILAH1]MCY0986473.1 hypothetical protein [Nannocystis sp. ILAH1]